MSKTLRIFDPALCCATGVCGTSIDPDLAERQALTTQVLGGN